MLQHRIRQLRLTRGLTQEQLAERLGVEHPTIHRWETGKTVEWLDKVEKLAAALGCHPGELFGDLPSSAPLSNDEEQLLAAFRLLSPPNKARILDIAEALATVARK